MSRSSMLNELHTNFKPLNVFFTHKCTKLLRLQESKVTPNLYPLSMQLNMQWTQRLRPVTWET